MAKKASIQVSANFLVVLIISIVIMGLGFFLLKDVIGGSGSQVAQLDNQLRDRIENMLGTDSIVSIPIVEKTARRGDVIAFGVGVMKVEGTLEHFGVFVEPMKAYSLKNGNEVTDTANWPVLMDGFDLLNDNDATYKLKNNEKYVFTVPIQVPKDAWANTEYIFDVYVCAQSDFNDQIPSEADCHIGNVDKFYDGTVHKLYVKVK